MTEDSKKSLERKLELAKNEGLPLRVFMYIPNIVGYIRIACLIVAYSNCLTNPRIFVLFYGASYVLDQVDGMTARAFGQCTSVLCHLS